MVRLSTDGYPGDLVLMPAFPQPKGLPLGSNCSITRHFDGFPLRRIAVKLSNKSSNKLLQFDVFPLVFPDFCWGRRSTCSRTWRCARCCPTSIAAWRPGEGPWWYIKNGQWWLMMVDGLLVVLKMVVANDGWWWWLITVHDGWWFYQPTKNWL